MIMRRVKESRLKPVNVNLETAKLLVDVFGYKIIKDIKITVKGGDKKDECDG